VTTVLVVEDEPLVRLVTVELLEDAGYEILEAPNAKLAIEILESRPDIRIVVTDVTMPGDMDGVKLAYYIRDKWPPIYLLLVSARPLEHPLPEQARFLPKPFSRNQLVASLGSFSPV